ncbi:ribonuclease HIII [Virgibacillus alimentarius]|nr:ribonuclease HIII [Virgibacillus alimentarius]
MKLGQSVHKLTLETINKMKKYYQHFLQDPPQGSLFRAKTKNAVITAYKSGKVLFQGASPEAEAGKWMNKQQVPKSQQKVTSQKTSLYTPPLTLFNNSHIGSDEAGTGDYFGPITVACTYVKKEQIAALSELGVKDSKNISDEQIRKLSKEIIKSRLPYSLLVLRNEKYNKLQKKGWSQGKMKAMLHHHAIKNLQQKINNQPLKGILIDQFCEPSLYKKYISSEKESLSAKTYFITKAESYSLAVAAGSIIARASFLNEMDKLSKKIGVPLQKGASYLVDQTIANIIKKRGKQVLHTCAKTHFANTNKAKKYL